jgi:hypothetical protein
VAIRLPAEVQRQRAGDDDEEQDAGADLHRQIDLGQRPPQHAQVAAQRVSPAHGGVLPVGVAEQAGQLVRLAADDQAVPRGQACLGGHVEEEARPAGRGDVGHHQRLAGDRDLADGSPQHQRPGADHHLGHLAPAVGAVVEAERPQRLPRQCR